MKGKECNGTEWETLERRKKGKIKESLFVKGFYLLDVFVITKIPRVFLGNVSFQVFRSTPCCFRFVLIIINLSAFHVSTTHEWEKFSE